MYRQVPNFITLARLGLTVAFFVLLNTHVTAPYFPQKMWWAFAIYIAAVGTDWLDGYLARTWKAESAFGRVVDPFVDKIMICGAFVFFSSTHFIDADVLKSTFSVDKPITAITGVAPWMAVLLIAREFLVTGIRGLAESRGIDFRADWAGKIKMGVQCFAVGAIIGDVAEAGTIHWIRWCRDTSIWVTLVVTVLSAIGYIVRARRIIKE